MDFLKKRPVALAISAVVLVFAVLFGINRTFSRGAKKTEKLFYADRGIQAQLDNAVNAARGLTVLCAESDALSPAAQALRKGYEAVMNAQTIPEKYAGYELLRSALDTYLSLREKPEAAAWLETADKEAEESYRSTLQNALRAASWSDYNEKVAEFYESHTGRFPMSILKIFLFSKGPAYLGEAAA